jgi:ATP/maltotriose-dependent transcriptional regulator MalT
MARRLGSERLEAMVLIRAAMRAAATGRAATAAGHMVDGLELGRRTGMWYLEEVNLLILVSTALAAGRPEAAAELHGALHDVLPGIKQRLPVRVGLAYDQTVAAIETALGADAFAQRTAVGSLWTWPQAVLQGEQLAVSIAAVGQPPVPGAAGVPGDHRVSLEGPRYRPELSGRERDVLTLIATGASNRDIGLRLGLQTKTVMHYTSALYRKLGVGGRAEAVSRAWRYGLLESDPDIQPRAESG